MSIFQTIKENITPRQAAERYGLPVNNKDMTRCPFHEDDRPQPEAERRLLLLLRLSSPWGRDKPCCKTVWHQPVSGSPKIGSGLWP